MNNPAAELRGILLIKAPFRLRTHTTEAICAPIAKLWVNDRGHLHSDAKGGYPIQDLK